MRSLLLALAFGLALAIVEEDGYKQGRDYVYRYEAQLMTGSPHTSKLWGGLRLTANLHLQFRTRVNVSCQFTDVTLYRMDKFIEERTPSFFIPPEELLNDGIEKDTLKMAKVLEEPFSMFWVSGNVLQVNLMPYEPLWSANIKRGALSVFQLNLNQKNPISPIINEDENLDPYQKSWTAYEPTPLGYCMTTYSPKPSPVDYKYITKVRDYKFCFRHPPVSSILSNFRPIPPYDRDQTEFSKTLQMTGEFSYAIRGSKSHFLILTAVGESKVVFRPYEEKEGHVQTSINQTMTLLDAFEIPDTSIPPIPRVPESPMHHKSLRMTMPGSSVEKNLDGEDMTYSLVHEDMMPPNKMGVWTKDKMMEMLILVASDNAEYSSENGLLLMQTLLEMIQTSPKEILQDLYLNVKNDLYKPNATLAPLMQKSLLHMMSVAGTTPAADVVLDQCLQDLELMNNNCSSLVNMIGTFAPPSARVIAKLFKLAMLRQNIFPSLRAACYLSAGSVMGRAVDRYNYLLSKGQQSLEAFDRVMSVEKRGSEIRNLREYKQKVKQAVAEMANKHESVASTFIMIAKTIKDSGMKVEDTLTENRRSPIYSNEIWWEMVKLKSLRNAHLPSSFPYILDVIHNVHNSPLVRIAAIQALDKFTTLHTEIWMEMEQILKNQMELPAVRIQAFKTLLSVRAPKHILVSVAGMMRYERSKQVSCFVWSVFNKLGNSSFPPYKELASNLTWARPHMSPIMCGIQDSSYHIMDTLPKHKMAMLSEFSFVQTPEFITKADLALSFDFMGIATKYLQLSWQSQGLERVLKSLVGAKGWWFKLRSLTDMIRRPRSVDVPSKIDEIWSKLGIHPRFIPNVQSILSLQFLNNDVRVWDLSDILQTIVDQGKIFTNIDQDKWSAGHPFCFQKTSFSSNFHARLPTEVGIPVLLQVGIAFSTNVKGSVQAEIEPKLYEPASASQYKTINVGVSVKPKIIVSVMGKMAADLFSLQAGLAFNTLIDIKAPFSVNASYSQYSAALKLSVSPPTQSDPILSAKVRPYVFSSAVPLDAPSKPIFKTMQIVALSNSAGIGQTAWSYGADTLGYNITLKREYVKSIHPHCVTNPLLGRADFHIYSTPGTNVPPAISATVKHLPMISPYSMSVSPTVTTTPPPPSPYPEHPDLLKETITFPMLQQKLQRVIGTPEVSIPVQTQWGLMAEIDSSTPTLERKLSMEAIFKRAENGQLSHAFFLLKRTPVPNYDPHPWQMIIKSESFFPARQLTIKDLISVKHRMAVQEELNALLKTKGHEVSNRFLNSTLSAMTSELIMRLLPSLEPMIILDRVVPEYIVSENPLKILRLKSILKAVLPVCQQIQELRGEMKDAVQIKTRQNLLYSLSVRLLTGQTKIFDFLKELGKNPTVPQWIVSSVQFAIYKLTQGTHDLDEIMQRAINLRIVSNIAEFENQCKNMSEQQLNVVRVAASVLPSLIIVDDTMKSAEKPIPTPYATAPSVKYGWNPIYSNDIYVTPTPYSSPEELPGAATVAITDIHLSLRKLTAHQLRVIEQLQDAVSEAKTIPLAILPPLLNSTAYNLTAIDLMLNTQQITSKTAIERLLQASLQHQIIVTLLRKSEYGRNLPLVSTALPAPRILSFAFKVQTRQLTERMALVLGQYKEDKVLLPVLKPEEIMMFKQMHEVERKLVIIQRTVQLPPNMTHPLATDLPHLKLALDILNQQLSSLKSLRDGLITLPELPSFIMVCKLMGDITILQKKILLFKAMLLSQEDPERIEVTRKYESLGSSALALRLGLSPIFEKYSSGDFNQNNEVVMPISPVPVSKSLLEVTEIRREQEELKKTVHNYLFLDQHPPPETITRVLQFLCDKLQTLLSKLKDAQPRVKLAIGNAGPVWQYSLFSEFYEALTEQRDMYDILARQMKQLESRSDEFALYYTRIASEIQDVELLIKKQDMIDMTPSTTVRPYTLPAEIPTISATPYFSKGVRSPYGDYFQPSADSPMGRFFAKVPTTTMLPSMSQTAKDLKATQAIFAPRGVVFVVNTTYGNIDGVQRNVNIALMATKSVGQLMWEAAQANPVTRDGVVHKALISTVEDRERIESSGQELIWRINTFQHLHIHVLGKPEDIPPGVSWRAMRLLDWIKHKLYPKTIVSPPLSFIQPNNPEILIDFSVTMNAFHMYVLGPRETTVIRNIPVPKFVKGFYPFQNVASVPYFALKYVSDKKLPGTCQVYKENVKTNDNSVYRLQSTLIPPNSKCEMLLAADCSPDKTFAITAMPGNTSEIHTEAIRILAESHEVMLIPDISPRVVVDGEEKILPPDLPIIYYRTEGKKSIIITKVSEPAFIKVELPLVGLIVSYKSMHTTIDMSTVYKSTLCGLCGNYDFQTTLDLEGPNRMPHPEVETFLRSYSIPSDTCLIPQPRTHLKTGNGFTDNDEQTYLKRGFGIDSDSEDIDDDEDDKDGKPSNCSPIEKTKVIEKKSEDKICFSEKPVKTCKRPSCKPERVRGKPNQKTLVDVICYKTSDPKLQHLVSELKKKAQNDAPVPEADIKSGGGKGEKAKIRVRSVESCIPRK